ncbi:unannotated protein [freshwater metagenome]|uniref:Unannotated protein n=1 Tax=freshwater metagenome TaxID=449393 RepID=A0A6J7E9R7_9ZZZZ
MMSDATSRASAITLSELFCASAIILSIRVESPSASRFLGVPGAGMSGVGLSEDTSLNAGA